VPPATLFFVYFHTPVHLWGAPSSGRTLPCIRKIRIKILVFALYRQRTPLSTWCFPDRSRSMSVLSSSSFLPLHFPRFCSLFVPHFQIPLGVSLQNLHVVFFVGFVLSPHSFSHVFLPKLRTSSEPLVLYSPLSEPFVISQCL